jgi:hypothetical protein
LLATTTTTTTTTNNNINHCHHHSPLQPDQLDCQVLERHHEGQPRARVFAHALWGVGTPEEWAVWEPWIQESLSAELYTEMAPLFVRGPA